jgi:hypothetical protein
VVPSTKVRGFLILVCAVVSYAQTTATPKPRAGLETDWDIAAVLQEIANHANRLTAYLDKLDTNAWVAKGASETYGEQVKSSRDQAKALATGATGLAANPERLSASLEVYFRIHAIETMLASIEEAIRRYQSPADAQALTILAAQNDGNRDRFQRYIVNLTSEREQDLVVMDREAQRCRGVITQVPQKTTPAPVRAPARNSTPATRTTRKK